MASGSPMIDPTRILGSSDDCGSWNMSCRSRRLRRSSAPRRADTPTPSSVTSPELGLSSATISLPSVVLPQPDSPTRPNVVPAGTEKDTSETALTLATWRRSRPALIGYSLTRFFRSSSGATPLRPAGSAAPGGSVTSRRPSPATSGASAGAGACSPAGAGSASGASATRPTRSPAAAWARLSASEVTSPVLAASGPRRADHGQGERAVDRVPAGEQVVGRRTGQRRLLRAALVAGPRAAGGEAAALRRVRQVGRQARDGVQGLAGVLVQLRDGGEQAPGCRDGAARRTAQRRRRSRPPGRRT